MPATAKFSDAALRQFLTSKLEKPVVDLSFFVENTSFSLNQQNAVADWVVYYRRCLLDLLAHLVIANWKHSVEARVVDNLMYLRTLLQDDRALAGSKEFGFFLAICLESLKLGSRDNFWKTVRLMPSYFPDLFRGLRTEKVSLDGFPVPIVPYGDSPILKAASATVQPSVTSPRRFADWGSEIFPYDFFPALTGPHGKVESHLPAGQKEYDPISFLDDVRHLDALLPGNRDFFRYFSHSVILIPHDQCFSGSNPAFPGTIYITHMHNDSLRTYESLIHETAHAKIQVLLQMRPLYNNSDLDLSFHHPWMSAARPLKGVLLGAHAFLNILQYYQSLLELGHEVSRIEKLFRYHFSDVGSALNELARGDLTPDGETFLALMRARYEELRVTHGL